MDLSALSRTGLLYAHLLLCVFALHLVLSTDWRLLQSRIGARGLHRAHVQVAWLFGGLWLSGLAIVALDTGLDPALIATKPKLVAKLVAVGVLTLNGALLRDWLGGSDRLYAVSANLARTEAFGIAFELPVVLTFLQMVGIVQPETLRSNRRISFVGIVILSAVVTPTGDPFTLLAIGGPMYILYEVSILIGSRLRKRRVQRATA